MTHLKPSNSSHFFFNVLQVHTMQIRALVAQLSGQNTLTAILVTVTQAMLLITQRSQLNVTNVYNSYKLNAKSVPREMLTFPLSHS